MVGRPATYRLAWVKISSKESITWSAKIDVHERLSCRGYLLVAGLSMEGVVVAELLPGGGDAGV